MKCPECGVKQKKDGEFLCCCGYQFIFHAGNAQGMTDARFFNLLRRAGENGRFYFTFPQLYSTWCQQDAEERISLLRKRLAVVGDSSVYSFCLVFFSVRLDWRVSQSDTVGWPLALDQAVSSTAAA